MVKHETVPFPYWVLDDFLPAEMAADAYTYFFDGDGPWTVRHHLYSKFKETRTTGLAWPVEAALRYLESDVVRASITATTGIGPLSADKDRFGGGQHVVYGRGRLGIHADFTHHPTTGMRRALNLLVYLNKPGDARGGELELWDKEMLKCQVKIKPTFNRAVLFQTSTTSYHGHPDPQQGIRRSLACYYYVLPNDPECPEEANCGLCSRLRTTDYRPRPWEYGLRLRRRLRMLVKGR